MNDDRNIFFIITPLFNLLIKITYTLSYMREIYGGWSGCIQEWRSGEDAPRSIPTGFGAWVISGSAGTGSSGRCNLVSAFSRNGSFPSTFAPLLPRASRNSIRLWYGRGADAWNSAVTLGTAGICYEFCQSISLFTKSSASLLMCLSSVRGLLEKHSRRTRKHNPEFHMKYLTKWPQVCSEWFFISTIKYLKKLLISIECFNVFIS